MNAGVMQMHTLAKRGWQSHRRPRKLFPVKGENQYEMRSHGQDAQIFCQTMGTMQNL